MPYIKRELRNELAEPLAGLKAAIAEYPEDADGILNYVISHLVADGIKPDYRGPWRYKDIARAVAVFECAKLEFYRRVAAPKEDKAIDENSDIMPYECLQV